MRVAQIELGEYVTVVANCRNSLKLSETHGADRQDQFVSTAVSQDLVAFFRQRNQTVGLVWADPSRRPLRRPTRSIRWTVCWAGMVR